MQIIDISNGLLSAEVYEGDPVPELERIKALSRGDSCNLSALYTGLHNGTHTDAPLHFMDGGMSVDRFPPEIFIGPCAVVEVSPGLITGAVVEEYFPRSAKRVLLRSGGRAHIHKSAAQTMADMGYLLVGTDGLSVEPPNSAEGETHRALLRQDIAILEGLDLSAVRRGEYFLIAPPLKLEGAEAAPTRALLVTDYIFWSGKPRR